MFYGIYQICWGKEIKCEACRAFYRFRNEFIQFSNTGAGIDFIYLMILKLLFGMKTSIFCHFYETLKLTSLHNITYKE